MFGSSAAVRVLLASALVLACGGVDDPAGELPSPRPLAGGAGAGQEAAGGSSPTTPTTPSAGGQGGTDPSSNPPPDVEAGGAGGDDALPRAVFCDAPTKIFVPSCGNGACHDNSAATIGDFGADAQRAYNFVDKDAVRHADCGRIIDSRDYSQSLILRKLTQGAFEVPHCGGIMPIPSYPPLNRDQIDCVASWLQQFQR
jgi:hypothetical protein